MSRENKFRAWDTDGKYFYYFDINMIFPMLHQNEMATKKIVQEFTGLFDKNGKEIFEGDRLRHPDIPNEIRVMFDNGCFMDEGTRIPLKDIYHWGDWLICGNRFEDGVRE